jgi:hypothetical protein
MRQQVEQAGVPEAAQHHSFYNIGNPQVTLVSAHDLKRVKHLLPDADAMRGALSFNRQQRKI